jgi:hypothetical protein
LVLILKQVLNRPPDPNASPHPTMVRRIVIWRRPREQRR